MICRKRPGETFVENLSPKQRKGRSTGAFPSLFHPVFSLSCGLPVMRLNYALISPENIGRSTAEEKPEGSDIRYAGRDRVTLLLPSRHCFRCSKSISQAECPIPISQRNIFSQLPSIKLSRSARISLSTSYFLPLEVTAKIINLHSSVLLNKYSIKFLLNPAPYSIY